LLEPGLVDTSVAAASVRVGGLTLNVASAPDGPDLVIGRAWKSFQVTPAIADIDLSVSWGELSDSDAGESLVFDSGGSWRLAAIGPKLIYSFFSSNLGPVPYKQLSIDRGLSRGEIVFHRPYFATGQALDPLQFPLDELLVTQRLSRGGGIELHACGVVDRDGRGYVFCGQSGDGKTTTARLWAMENGCRILSDDRIIVGRGSSSGLTPPARTPLSAMRRGAEGEAPDPAALRMFGTPWHGEAEFALNESAELSAIYVLARGDANRATSLDPPQAVASLLTRSFVSFADSDGMAWTLSFLEEIAAGVPCRRLEFVPDENVVDFVRGLAPGLRPPRLRNAERGPNPKGEVGDD
jgi:hypothetical protein